MNLDAKKQVLGSSEHHQHPQQQQYVVLDLNLIGELSWKAADPCLLCGPTDPCLLCGPKASGAGGQGDREGGQGPVGRETGALGLGAGGGGGARPP